MNVSYNESNDPVDILASGAGSLSAKMFDFTGEEITFPVPLCMNQSTELVWEMTASDSTLQSLEDRPKLDDLSNPS